MTRGDGTTYDTDAHFEWGFVIDGWPEDDQTSFIALDSEQGARDYVTLASINQDLKIKLARRTIGHAQEVAL